MFVYVQHAPKVIKYSKYMLIYYDSFNGDGSRYLQLIKFA